MSGSSQLPLNTCLHEGRLMILVTGGTGYIGAHVTLELMNRGEDVVILDNLCNSSRTVVDRIAGLTGRRPAFVMGDVRNRALLDSLLRDYPVNAVIHCAGLKAVGESVREPLRYYDTNVGGSVTLCQAMADAGVFTLVFSSSATVYGDCAVMPIDETCATGQPTNPYGQSKLMAENVMKSMAVSDARWSVGLLRYFNPIGAHDSGELGEMPTRTPNNLLPYLLQVANGQRRALSVFGSDYATQDGTGVRDYVHVMDLAEGHFKALQSLRLSQGVRIWNFGTGQGYSVLEVVKAFERVSGVHVPLLHEPRRAGDIARCWADPAKASMELGWRAQRSLDCMLADAWRWQCNSQPVRVPEQSAVVA
jgi:UDP-glucose 4-epimerase